MDRVLFIFILIKVDLTIWYWYNDIDEKLIYLFKGGI